MTADVVDTLSDEHREPVRAALDAAFGSSRVDSIALIGGGASGAFLFRVDVGRQRYVVRLEGQPSPLRNPHQYESMRIASAVGIPWTLWRGGHSALFPAARARFPEQSGRSSVACKERRRSQPLSTTRKSLIASGGGYAKQASLRPACLIRARSTRPVRPVDVAGMRRSPRHRTRPTHWLGNRGSFPPDGPMASRRQRP